MSGTGGATEGYKYCMDAAIGKSKIPYSEWECIGFTYDTKKVSVYVNGYRDVRKEMCIRDSVRPVISFFKLR